MSRILVAGLGNIFQGDDAFGVEVVQRLLQRKLPSEVTVVDFGIRGLDLTYALLDGYGSAVLIDTMRRGQPPGTVSVIEPELAATDPPNPEDLALSPHDLDPAQVLRLISALGGECRHIVLVACEPASFGDEEGTMGLSPPVAAVLDDAVAAVELLVSDMLQKEVSG